MSVTVISGDCREVLAALPEQSVQCCVTSPPYFGLRDYGVEGQIGLEPTPDEFVAQMVAVFREVRRVLRDDGTLWLNLGDSYAANRTYQVEQTKGGAKHGPAQAAGGRSQRAANYGLKAKDLIGIPWSVAKALQAPFYSGRIAAERDRAWLAAIMDGEGTICGFSHERKDDGRTRTGINVCVTNSCDAMLNECARIWPASRSEHMAAGAGHLGGRLVERWIPHGAENKSALLAELYPYLISKKQQALVGWNLAQLVMTGKSDGQLPHGAESRAKRGRLVEILSDLNNRRPVDLPNWLLPIPSLHSPGWWLRQDIIWAKPNPMPESVTDRCTKAHEHLFLLTKSERYYFDSKAIAEPAVASDLGEMDGGAQRLPNGANANGGRNFRGLLPGNKSHKGATAYLEGAEEHRTKEGLVKYSMKVNADQSLMLTRNRRSVWTVATQPFKEAHFATFPPALIEPCILAGSKPGDMVLDPFGGAGTTGLVCDRLGRSATLIELNPAYAAMARNRIAADAPLLAETIPHDLPRVYSEARAATRS